MKSSNYIFLNTSNIFKLFSKKYVHCVYDHNTYCFFLTIWNHLRLVQSILRKNWIERAYKRNEKRMRSICDIISLHHSVAIIWEIYVMRQNCHVRSLSFHYYVTWSIDFGLVEGKLFDGKTLNKKKCYSVKHSAISLIFW